MWRSEKNFAGSVPPFCLYVGSGAKLLRLASFGFLATEHKHFVRNSYFSFLFPFFLPLLLFVLSLSSLSVVVFRLGLCSPGWI